MPVEVGRQGEDTLKGERPGHSQAVTRRMGSTGTSCHCWQCCCSTGCVQAQRRHALCVLPATSLLRRRHRCRRAANGACRCWKRRKRGAVVCRHHDGRLAYAVIFRQRRQLGSSSCCGPCLLNHQHGGLWMRRRCHRTQRRPRWPRGWPLGCRGARPGGPAATAGQQQRVRRSRAEVCVALAQQGQRLAPLGGGFASIGGKGCQARCAVLGSLHSVQGAHGAGNHLIQGQHPARPVGGGLAGQGTGE